MALYSVPCYPLTTVAPPVPTVPAKVSSLACSYPGPFQAARHPCRLVRHRAAIEGSIMSKKQGKKVVVFTLTKPKSEVPFATLRTRLGKFKALRAQFEELGLRVEVKGFKG
jgi:hypothetical protein